MKVIILLKTSVEHEQMKKDDEQIQITDPTN
jgi:hypothetical protein